jgi:hypothetical protein
LIWGLTHDLPLGVARTSRDGHYMYRRNFAGA